MKIMSWSRYHLMAKSMSRIARRCHAAEMLKTQQRAGATHRRAHDGNADPKRP